MARIFKIDNINKTVNFTFDYDEKIIKEIKKVDYNHRWNPELKEWIVPVNDYSKPRILELIRAWGFKQTRVVEDDVDVSYEATPIDYAYVKGLCDSKDFSYEARKYQLEALGYGLAKGNIINGDDVGLGKTFEAIMYAEVTNAFPCLVIVPSSVKYNWEEKWLEITKNRTSIGVIETKETKKRKNNWDADVVVINYDIIGKKQGRGARVRFPELLEKEWKMIIFDEAHFLKKTKSMRAKAAAKIAKKNAVIQMLSGTITMNKPVELWNLLVLAKVEHLIADNWKQFIYRYCGAYKSKFGWNTSGATNTLELNRKMRDVCYIRREKRDVLSELPDVTKQVLRAKLSNNKEYTEASNNFIEYVRTTLGEAKADKAMEAQNLVALGLLRKLTIQGKLRDIEQYLKDWHDGGTEKLLIFGLHREPLNYLSEKFKSKLIAGGTKSKDKLTIVKDWKDNDDLFLFANMQSAGTGVDGLQYACSNMLIIELPWRPSDIEQCIGRLDRSGQTVPVTVTFMLAKDTIDDDMWDMLAEKEQVTQAVNKGIDIMKTDSGMKSIMKKILGRLKK